MTLYIGLLSGTSMDGIDAALVDVSTNTLIEGITCPYSDTARLALNNVIRQDALPLPVISQLNSLIGKEFANSVQELLCKVKVPIQDIVAIGSHGQTLCHDAMAEIPYTLQVGCAHTIAELTGITVVADFRTRDLVLGGQGAPLAPLYHQILFKSHKLPLAVANIGGIANISYLYENAYAKGYDVGPGNCLLDLWAQKNLNQPYDKGGIWAGTGTVIPSLLDDLLSDPYFALPAPKSIGKEYFSPTWLGQYIQPHFASQDVQATLLELSAITIAQNLQDSNKVQRLLLCGGGAHNHTLLKVLTEKLPNMTVETTQSYGINPDFIEAMMFAWLAEKTINRTLVDLTGITGASSPALLGAIYLPSAPLFK